jgi:hypothetical protein
MKTEKGITHAENQVSGSVSWVGNDLVSGLASSD